ncbi:hypothetical protein HG531_003263 [Fusarium graminearum]|nr:hypothetical protein HG531_003263 [Fusarium graminearum]
MAPLARTDPGVAKGDEGRIKVPLARGVCGVDSAGGAQLHTSPTHTFILQLLPSLFNIFEGLVHGSFGGLRSRFVAAHRVLERYVGFELFGIQSVKLVRSGCDSLQNDVYELNGWLGRQGRDNRLIEAQVACDVANVHVCGRHGRGRIRSIARYSSFPKLRARRKGQAIDE